MRGWLRRKADIGLRTIGLMAAIPAVMAYNFVSRRIRVITAEMETFSSDFLNIVRRRFF